jgi:hypothetical protein
MRCRGKMLISEADVRKTAFSRSSSFLMERYWLASHQLLMLDQPQSPNLRMPHGSAAYRSDLPARVRVNRNCGLNVASRYILFMGPFISDLPKGIRIKRRGLESSHLKRHFLRHQSIHPITHFFCCRSQDASSLSAHSPVQKCRFNRRCPSELWAETNLVKEGCSHRNGFLLSYNKEKSKCLESPNTTKPILFTLRMI